MSKHAAVPAAERTRPCLDLQALYEEHADFVLRLVQHLLGPGSDPDDVTQDVFVIAWRKLHRFEGGDLRAWLRQIAIKRSASWRRRASFRRFLGLEAAGVLIDHRTPERAVEANDACRIAYAALERIPESRRTAFILYEYQGMSGREIAGVLGCPLKTVWTRLHRARSEFEVLVAAQDDRSGEST